jgi:hypothetical protein
MNKIPHSFAAAKEFLGDRESKQIPGKRATKITFHKGNDYSMDYYSLSYHKTWVVTWYADGRISLNTGGYRSVTTKRRINDAIFGKGSVYQRKGKWFFYDSDSKMDTPFEDFMVINKLEAFR